MIGLVFFLQTNDYCWRVQILLPVNNRANHTLTVFQKTKPGQRLQTPETGKMTSTPQLKHPHGRLISAGMFLMSLTKGQKVQLGA